MDESLPRSNDHQPKERLLDAAEELFAARGFGEVSVRELAAAAEVNVAAINYHFQSKENLFQEVITRRFSIQRDRTLEGLQLLLEQTEGRPQVEQVIQVMVGEYMDGALSNSFLTMITREMHGGKGGTHVQFFKEMVAPIFMAFSQALIAARPSLKMDDLNWVIASIVGQIHHFILRRIKCVNSHDNPEALEFMHRALPALALDQDAYVKETTNHIARFSTAAINGLFPEEN